MAEAEIGEREEEDEEDEEEEEEVKSQRRPQDNTVGFQAADTM